MTSESALQQAFLTFSTAYLNMPPEEGVDPKIFEAIGKVVLRMDFSSVPTPAAGSFEEKKMEELKAQFKDSE